jgi:hypothetical protein
VVPDGDAITIRANIVHVEVAIAGSLTPLDSAFENRPGLVDAPSRRARAPEAPAWTTAAPNDVPMHQFDQRLDVAVCESLVRIPGSAPCEKRRPGRCYRAADVAWRAS